MPDTMLDNGGHSKFSTLYLYLSSDKPYLVNYYTVPI